MNRLPDLTGKRTFIIAGGPRLDYEKVELLKDEWTIGVNSAFLFDPKINYSNDRRFYNLVENHPKWEEYSGIKVFQSNGRQPYPKDVITIKPNNREVVALRQNGFWHGNNSGFGAIQLAIYLGSREIYLLGFDMECAGHRVHWHCEYAHQNNTPEFRNEKLLTFKKQIEDFAPMWFSENIDIQIIGFSTLRCFERTTLQEVLQSHL